MEIQRTHEWAQMSDLLISERLRAYEASEGLPERVKIVQRILFGDFSLLALIPYP